MESNLHSRAIRATVNFLENRRYDIVDKLFSQNIDIVAVDEDGEVHFVKVTVSMDSMPSTDISEYRADFEAESIKYLAKNADWCEGRQLIFDVADLVVVGTDKAMLRFHINCLSQD